MDTLPRELLSEILKRVSACGASPADLCSAGSVNKALKDVAREKEVLKEAGAGTLSVRRVNMGPGAMDFLRSIWESGSLDALYTAGMIHFYCKLEYGVGGEMLARAASYNHGPSLFQCAVTLISGSGGQRLDASQEGANELLYRASLLGYRAAAWELGSRIVRGVGVTKNKEVGCNVIRLAKAGEFHKLQRLLEPIFREQKYALCSSFLPAAMILEWPRKSLPTPVSAERRASWKALAQATHQTLQANTWHRDLFACSSLSCGRTTNDNKRFRRCEKCRISQYCSIFCQAMDRRRHLETECGLRW